MNDDVEDVEPSLPKLLAALAMGARAVHSLPLGDDFDFQSSFPEFSELRDGTLERLVQLLGENTAIILENDNPEEPSQYDYRDPEFWDACADACDVLLEQAETYAHDGADGSTQVLQEWSDKARQQARGQQARILSGLVDMEKPQITHGIQVQNDRTQPFIPKVHPDKPYSVVPLDISLQPGHGLDSRIDGTVKAISPHVIAPSHHAPHVYQQELQALEFRPWQLQAPLTKPSPIVASAVPLTATWVDTQDQLTHLAQILESTKYIAMDLEAHSHHSFSGLTCLIQLTLQNPKTNQSENYLIDTLKLYHCMNQYLAPALANPDVVKILHGANADVQWLQRDFGLYIVNLFDTGRAARALKFPSAGLAYLLKKYVESVQVDKTHQLSDWRQRPLPSDMRQYAIMDTHYLLDIYQHLLWDLGHHPEASILQVLEASRKVCLSRYDKEPFLPEGYKRLLLVRNNKKKRYDLLPSQERVLEALYDWRDATARACDESVASICSNAALVRVSMACPKSVTALQSLFNPMPRFLLQFSHQVLDRIKQGLEEQEEADDDEEDADMASAAVTTPSGAPSSAFFKPMDGQDDDDDEEREDNGILSPVLATEEMYKQAGWMTPQVVEVVTTTDDDDDVSDNAKPRKLLVVDTANKNCQAKEYTSHSLAMGGNKSKMNDGKTVDGLGPARATEEEDDAAGGNSRKSDGASLEEQAKRAHINAVRIRTGMTSQHEDLLGLISPTADLEDDEEGDVGGGGGASGEPDDPEAADGDSDEDFVIPKSMREIYKISNRNRRNKNSISPTNLERSGVMPEQMDVDTLAGAEAVLKKSGFYAEEVEGSKRQKSDSGGAAPSREQDIEFMKSLGWIKSKEELDAMLEPPSRENAEDISSEAIESSMDRETPTDGESKASASTGKDTSKSASPFDYSSIGPIGVYNPAAPPAANPFFGGASTMPRESPSISKQGTTKRAAADKKKTSGKGKPGRGGKQQERPDKRGDRTAVYKKR